MDLKFESADYPNFCADNCGIHILNQQIAASSIDLRFESFGRINCDNVLWVGSSAFGGKVANPFGYTGGSGGLHNN